MGNKNHKRNTNIIRIMDAVGIEQVIIMMLIVTVIEVGSRNTNGSK